MYKDISQENIDYMELTILLLEHYSFLTSHCEHHYIKKTSLQVVFKNVEKT